MTSNMSSRTNLKKLDGEDDVKIKDVRIKDVKIKEDITESKGILEDYKTLLIKYPLILNAIQSAAISSCSVLVSQYLAGRSQIDWSEVRTVSFIGAFWITPVLLVFYSRLQRLRLGVLGKLAVDQFLFSPIFTTSIITARMILLRRVEFSDFPKILMQTVPTAVLSAWTFWIPARGFTLLIVPMHLHLLAGSVFSFIWNIILSMLLNS